MGLLERAGKAKIITGLDGSRRVAQTTDLSALATALARELKSEGALVHQDQ